MNGIRQNLVRHKKKALLPAAAALMLSAPAGAQVVKNALPDAPSALLATDAPAFGIAQPIQQTAPPPQTGNQNLPPTIAAPGTQLTDQQLSTALPPCPRKEAPSRPIIFLPQTGSSCQREDQLQLIVESGDIRPLSPSDKGVLAIRAVTEPFNLLTITAFSGFSIAFDSHSVYGPGFKGWGRLAGYSLAEDIQGEFTGTYLLPVLFHEDPRYHRMPGRPIVRRVEHALIHTIVSQHDDGSLMPNYATLINYPLSAEISNLYVPGLPTNAPSTAKRVALGYATDPVGPLVAEFLPDLAKRVHIHIVFAQQILNRIALGNTTNGNSPL